MKVGMKMKSTNKSNTIHKRNALFNRWIYVFTGIIIMMCIGTVYSYSVFRLPIEEVFNIGTTESGMPYMVALASYALFMLITGRFINRYRPKVLMIFGGLVVSIGWILSAFAPNIVVLTITYGIISGGGVGITYGVPMNVVAKWFPEKKGLAVGMVLIGFGMSPLVTAPIARGLVEQYGVRDTFLMIGICFGVLIPLLSLKFKYPLEEPRDYDKTSFLREEKLDVDTRGMIKSQSFKGLYVNFIIGAMIGLMLIGLTSNIGVELMKLSSKKVASLIAVFAIFNGAGRPIFGWLTDQLSPKKAILMSFGLILLASLFMLFAKEGDGVIYTISFSIYWFNLGGWLAIAPASTLILYGDKHYSQNYGVVFTAYGIAAIIGVMTSGMLIDILGNYHYIFYYAIALSLIGIFSTIKLVRD